VKNTNLDNLTIVQLVERFAALGIEEDKAVFDDDNAKYNRLYWQMDAVKQELKRRPGDEQRALLPFFDHPNMWVRLMAAKGTLAVAPEAAQKMLQAIEAWGRQPYAGDAGMCLVNLDRGIFVPE
jgi:cytochrome c oxidase assembly protein Cox11